jgi:hypothetical protein
MLLILINWVTERITAKAKQILGVCSETIIDLNRKIRFIILHEYNNKEKKIIFRSNTGLTKFLI